MKKTRVLQNRIRGLELTLNWYAGSQSLMQALKSCWSSDEEARCTLTCVISQSRITVLRQFWKWTSICSSRRIAVFLWKTWAFASQNDDWASIFCADAEVVKREKHAENSMFCAALKDSEERPNENSIDKENNLCTICGNNENTSVAMKSAL